MTDEKDVDGFDFHSGADGDMESAAIFDAYMQCKNALQKIPRKFRSATDEQTIFALMRENLRRDRDGTRLFRKRSDAEDLIARFWLGKASEAALFSEAYIDYPDYVPLKIDYLETFARLSVKVDNIYLVEKELQSAGIVLVYEPSIPGMKVDGAAFLLPSGRPVIALSLRYARLDLYWFVLMHELAHIVVHRDLLGTPILDDADDAGTNDIEIEADLMAGNALIPRNVWRSAGVKYNPSEAGVLSLAETAATHPAVVVGRLQREIRRHDIFAKILHSVNVREMIFGHE